MKSRQDWLNKLRQGAAVLRRTLNRAPTEAIESGKGTIVRGSVTNAAGTRAYRLYVPSAYKGQPLPLIVMLHGCTQTPDDFAAGTAMDELGEESACLVVYPGQAHSANGSNCWNWFLTKDQHRDRGEPSIIADIAKSIAAQYAVDRGRVYVAGLSAGGAMAAIMAAAYPDVFAAVGIHSGLAQGAAHDLPSAMRAMKSGRSQKAKPSASAPIAGPSVPVIVFHGDHDKTVHPSNGEEILARALEVELSLVRSSAQVQKGQAHGGRAFTRSIYRRADGTPAAEHWIIHGAGHAWSGGTRDGSYTDPAGPSAARAMVQFFLQQPRR